MVQKVSAQIAMLGFGAAIVAGIYAGNSPLTIMSRALLVMFGALFAAQMAGWSARRVLREHLQQRKVAIDREHLAASQSEPTEGST